MATDLNLIITLPEPISKLGIYSVPVTGGGTMIDVYEVTDDRCESVRQTLVSIIISGEDPEIRIAAKRAASYKFSSA